jgi:NitT/TauT family transport system permease protein
MTGKGGNKNRIFMIIKDVIIPVINLKTICTLSVFILFILIWEGACHYLTIAPYTLPAPHLILASISGNAAGLLRAMMITLAEALLGFTVAIAFGFTAGCLFAHSQIAKHSFYPYMITL